MRALTCPDFGYEPVKKTLIPPLDLTTQHRVSVNDGICGNKKTKNHPKVVSFLTLIIALSRSIIRVFVGCIDDLVSMRILFRRLNRVRDTIKKKADLYQLELLLMQESRLQEI